MLRCLSSIALSLALVLNSFGPVSIDAATMGQIRGTAVSQSGRHLASLLARVRSLDIGHIADVATTNGSGEFTFSGLSAGRYIVELLSNGAVVGTSAPVVLSERSMTASGVTATAGGLAQVGGFGGSFWTSTLGIIAMGAIAAGVTTALVVARDDESPSR